MAFNHSLMKIAHALCKKKCVVKEKVSLGVERVSIVEDVCGEFS